MFKRYTTDLICLNQEQLVFHRMPTMTMLMIYYLRQQCPGSLISIHSMSMDSLCLSCDGNHVECCAHSSSMYWNVANAHRSPLRFLILENLRYHHRSMVIGVCCNMRWVCWQLNWLAAATMAAFLYETNPMSSISSWEMERIKWGNCYEKWWKWINTLATLSTMWRRKLRGWNGKIVNNVIWNWWF